MIFFKHYRGVTIFFGLSKPNHIVKLTFSLILVINFQLLASANSRITAPLMLKSVKVTNEILEIESQERFRLLSIKEQLSSSKRFALWVAQGKRDVRVTGKIVDETDQPIIGATVKVKGKVGGVTSDAQGMFSIIVAEDAILIFSYVSYDSQEVKVDGRTSLNIKLKPSSQKLNEVVVVGYGTQRRADVTGSIASVNSGTITRAATPDATGALQGNIAGVTVTKRVGKPGSGFDINVRGISSLGGANSPLYVIDGIPTTSGLNDLNPADIDKIDVLKDASATAIYGSRGAKGVVIVTTKRGKAGKTVMSYDSYLGARTPSNLPDMMSGNEYVAFMTQLFKNTGRSTERSNTAFFTADEWKNIDAQNFTDWPSMFLQNGLQMNQNLTVSGGDEKTRFSFGAGFLREQGNVAPEDFKRYSLRGSIDRQINEKWKAGINFYAGQNLRNEGSQETLRSAYRLNPVASAVDANGSRINRPVANNQGIFHPTLDQENELRENRSLRAFGQLYVQVQPIKSLTIKSSFSPSATFGRYGWYRGMPSKNANDNQAVSWAENGTNETVTWILDNQATYERSFGLHKITATAIQSIQKDRTETNSADGINLPFNSLWYNLGSARNTLPNGTLRAPVINSNFRKTTLASARGRINYSYRDKYLVTLSGTWDGSSILAPGNKWSFFPSAAFAWRLSEEGFIKNISAINDLKFRLSYGESGNDRVAPYQTQSTLSSSTYYFGNTLAAGYAPGILANKGLSWETTREVNLGLDFSLFSNRISGTVDVYNRNISDLLLNRNLPGPGGFSSVLDNIGKIRNRGVEIGLSTINIQKGKFTWKSDFVFDANKNAILETGNGKKDDIGAAWFIGQPAVVNYDYVFDGIWQADQAAEAAKFGQIPGTVRAKDISGPNGVPDGVITDAYDRQVIGKRVPSWTGSLANTFKYGNIDLYVMAHTRQGEQFRSQFHQTFTALNTAYFNQARVDYWTPQTPSQTTPAPGGTPAQTRFNYLSFFKSGNFVRISNITLGYTVSSRLLDKLKINNLRIYATATNPFLFSEFNGYDPEWSADNVFAGAVSSSSYIFGLNLGF